MAQHLVTSIFFDGSLALEWEENSTPVNHESQRLERWLFDISKANFRDRYLMPALKWGLVEMTLPDKSRSSSQRYRLTPRGAAVLRRKQ
jgi:ATP-dependent DNA helicase RecG